MSKNQMYVGLRILTGAVAMTLGEYHEEREKELPEGNDPNAEGMKVIYSDESTAWFTKEKFEQSFSEITKKEADGLMRSETLSEDLKLIGNVRDNIAQITKRKWSLKEFAKKTLEAAGVDLEKIKVEY